MAYIGYGIRHNDVPFVLDVFTGNGSNIGPFTLSVPKPISSRAILVTIDGLVQDPEDAYSLNANGDLIFTGAPPNLSTINVLHLGARVEIGTPATNSVDPGAIKPGDFWFDTDTLYVDAGNNRVGIGTTSPADTLHVVGDIQLTGNLKGPATMVIDPALHGDTSGTVVIAGDLQVDGTTTTLNSTTLTVDDKNIVLASGAADAAAANGAGITVDGANATILYDGGNDIWTLNKTLQANLSGNVIGNVTGNVTGTVSDVSNHSIGDLQNIDISTNAPSNGETLVWNGTNFVPGAASGGGGGLANVADDTTPQLGGDLDVNGNTITNVTGNLSLHPAAGYLHLGLGNAANYSVAMYDRYYFPAVAPGAGQVLQANATTPSELEWVTPATGTAYTNADVDTHLNQSTAQPGQILSWNGADYDWIPDQGSLSLQDLTNVNNATPTDGQILHYVSANNQFEFTDPPTLTADSVNQKLVYTDTSGTANDIDLSWAVDDTNLARITSGTVNSTTGIATFTRDDATTFTVDFSGFLEADTLASVSARGATTTDNVTFNGAGNSVKVGDTLRIAETGSGLRMTNVGAFDNDGASTPGFRVYATNDLYLRANGETGAGITIDKTNQHVAVANNLNVDGNIGVGTDNPTELIHARSSAASKIKVSNSGTDWAALEVETSEYQSAYIFLRDNGGERARIQSTSGNDFRILTGGGSIAGLTQDNLGNVGINTDAPGAKLEVNGAATTGTHAKIVTTGSGHNFDMVDGTSTARMRNVAGRLHLTADANNEAADSEIRLLVDNDTKLSILSNGYLAAQSAQQVRLVLGNAGNPLDNTSNWIRGNQNYLQFNNAGSGYTWETTGTTKMTLTAAGDLSVAGNLAGLKVGSITSNGTGNVNIPTSYANLHTTYYRWNLPDAGTYVLFASLRTRLWGVTGFIQYRIYNDTTSTVIPNSQQMSWEDNTGGENTNVMSTPHWALSVTGPTTIMLQGASTDGSTNSSLQSDINGYNVCTWIKLRD